MEPVTGTPKPPAAYNWLMGVMVGVGALQVFVQLTERNGSPGRTVSILLNLLLIVCGGIGFVGNRNRRGK